MIALLLLFACETELAVEIGDPDRGAAAGDGGADGGGTGDGGDSETGGTSDGGGDTGWTMPPAAPARTTWPSPTRTATG